MDKKHKHLLVAVELNSDEDQLILQKAKKISGCSKEDISLVHVVDYFDNYGVSSSHCLVAGIEKEEFEMRKKIKNLAKNAGVPKKNCYVKTGVVKDVISEVVKVVDSDLLVVGNHGRHGFKSLFYYNNTTSLIKSMDCDILAVRV